MFVRLATGQLRLLSFIMAVVMAGTALVVPCGFDRSPISSNISASGPHGSCDDTDCCSSCFCCHGAAVVNPVEAMTAFGASRLAEARPYQFIFEGSLSPSDQPPRT
jgi:hypothetical protein